VKTAYLDIETNYLGPYPYPRMFEDFANHEITVVGIRLLEPGADRFVQLIEKDVSRESLLAALEGAHRLVTYNGRSQPDPIKKRIGFDFPVIAARTGLMLDKQFEHLDLCPACWGKNLYGGLKKVELALGLHRKMPGRDGLWASEMWKKWKSTGESAALDALLEYNREDVYMLYEVEKALARLP
jgi:uncharacterized protein YprB with RNaseH-like and TPR domain